MIAGGRELIGKKVRLEFCDDDHLSGHLAVPAYMEGEIGTIHSIDELYVPIGGVPTCVVEFGDANNRWYVYNDDLRGHNDD